MAIYADLKDFPLAEMLFMLSNRQSSGRLVVTSGEQAVAFTLHAGQITAVESSDPRQRLGQYLLRNGIVAQPALMQVLDQQRGLTDHRVVGELIVERGLADPMTVSRVLDAQVIAILAEILLRDDGSLSFEQVDTQPRGIEAVGTIAQQIFEGLRRADESRAIGCEDAPPSGPWPEAAAELVPFVDDDVLSVAWDHPRGDASFYEPERSRPLMTEAPTAIQRLSSRLRELVRPRFPSMETGER